MRRITRRHDLIPCRMHGATAATAASQQAQGGRNAQVLDLLIPLLRVDGGVQAEVRQLCDPFAWAACVADNCELHTAAYIT